MKEKNVQNYSEEIIHLKKASKNKKKRETWQKVLDFYRNNQGNLSNMQILKLLRIALKPIVQSTKRIMSDLGYMARGQNKQQTIVQKLNVLKKRIQVLWIIFETFTLIIETFLREVDVVFFNNIFEVPKRKMKIKKQVLFEPSHINHPWELNTKNAEHELKGYFKYVCCLSKFLVLSQFYQANHKKTINCLEVAKKINLNICKSPQFKLAESQFQNLNILIRYRLENFQQPDSFNQPIEVIYQLYKKCSKWTQQKKLKSFTLIIKHIYLSILQNKNRQYDKKFPSKIYAAWKEIQKVKMFCNLSMNCFQRKLFEFMSSFCDSFEQMAIQQKQINYIITKYFSEATILSLDHQKQLKEQDFANTTNHKQFFQNQNDKTKKIISKVTFSNFLEVHKDQNTMGFKDFSIKFKALKQKLKEDIFNMIEESDSDEQGNLKYEFEVERKKELRRQNEKTFTLVFAASQKRNTKQEKEQDNLRQKIEGLRSRTQKLRSFSHQAIKELHKKKAEIKLIDNYQVQVGEYGKKCKKVKTNRQNNQQRLKIITGIKRINNVKQLEQPIVGENKQKSIMLSEKYDGLSKMILLSNTNKENPYDV